MTKTIWVLERAGEVVRAFDSKDIAKQQEFILNEQDRKQMSVYADILEWWVPPYELVECVLELSA